MTKTWGTPTGGVRDGFKGSSARNNYCDSVASFDHSRKGQVREANQDPEMKLQLTRLCVCLGRGVVILALCSTHVGVRPTSIQSSTSVVFDCA
jgi:hypothetical protein